MIRVFQFTHGTGTTEEDSPARSATASKLPLASKSSTLASDGGGKAVADLLLTAGDAKRLSTPASADAPGIWIRRGEGSAAATVFLAQSLAHACAGENVRGSLSTDQLGSSAPTA